MPIPHPSAQHYTLLDVNETTSIHAILEEFRRNGYTVKVCPSSKTKEQEDDRYWTANSLTIRVLNSAGMEVGTYGLPIVSDGNNLSSTLNKTKERLTNALFECEQVDRVKTYLQASDYEGA